MGGRKAKTTYVPVSLPTYVPVSLPLLTGRKPNKWMMLLMSLYLGGWASEADVPRELNKPDNRGVKTRARDELWKKLGVS
jgi:hypothetical protein